MALQGCKRVAYRNPILPTALQRGNGAHRRKPGRQTGSGKAAADRTHSKEILPTARGSRVPIRIGGTQLEMWELERSSLAANHNKLNFWYCEQHHLDAIGSVLWIPPMHRQKTRIRRDGVGWKLEWPTFVAMEGVGDRFLSEARLESFIATELGVLPSRPARSRITGWRWSNCTKRSLW